MSSHALVRRGGHVGVPDAQAACTPNIDAGQSTCKHASLLLAGSAGQRVVRLWDGPLGPGAHRVEWDGRDDSGRLVASGVYLSRLQVGGIAQVKRMVRVR